MTMKVKPKEPRISGNESKPERRVKAAHLKFDDEGRELMDPTPIAPPIGYKKSKSIAEQIREMVRSERLKQETAAQGYESFEEADDFEIGDDYDPKSPYEEVFEPLPDTSEDRLMSLGDHIGRSIVSQLGGEVVPSPAAAPADSKQPPGSGRRELPEKKEDKQSPTPGPVETFAAGKPGGSFLRGKRGD